MKSKKKTVKRRVGTLTKAMVIDRLSDTFADCTTDHADAIRVINQWKAMPASVVVAEAQGVFGWDASDAWFQ